MHAERPTRFLPGLHEIEGYGRGGFRFGGMSHQGSILLLPSGVQAWSPADPARLTLEDIAALVAERDAFDYLLVGCGLRALSPASPLGLALRDAGLNAELMDTAAAARTFNVLLAEKRRIAAALIAIA
jgi:uncharacterized protein